MGNQRLPELTVGAITTNLQESHLITLIRRKKQFQHLLYGHEGVLNTVDSDCIVVFGGTHSTSSGVFFRDVGEVAVILIGELSEAS